MTTILRLRKELLNNKNNSHGSLEILLQSILKNWQIGKGMLTLPILNKMKDEGCTKFVDALETLFHLDDLSFSAEESKEKERECRQDFYEEFPSLNHKWKDQICTMWFGL